jgi:hypothetical protein
VDEDETYTFTVYIADITDVPILNDSYGVCASEGVCTIGEILTSTVEGPMFSVSGEVDPIAKNRVGVQAE